MNLQRIRVPIGFLFAALFLYLSRPTPTLLLLGLSVALSGLAIRVWATGHLRKWERLAVDGPYSWTRNPLYFGSFLMGLGLVIASAHWVLVTVFLLLFVFIYRPVMRREEGELMQAYGDDFVRYRQSVPLFFPRPARSDDRSDPRAGNFQWSQVISNREYNAMIGLIAVSLVLIAKLFWL